MAGVGDLGLRGVLSPTLGGVSTRLGKAAEGMEVGNKAVSVKVPSADIDVGEGDTGPKLACGDGTGAGDGGTLILSGVDGVIGAGEVNGSECGSAFIPPRGTLITALILMRRVAILSNYIYNPILSVK